MKPSPRPARVPFRFSDSLHHPLNLYTLAAGAAGVSLLALAEPCAGKVVYTKAHQAIGTGGIYGLDLNNDGTMDFVIRERGNPFSTIGSNRLEAKGALGNAVEGNSSAAALSEGSPISQHQNFSSGTSYAAEAMVVAYCTGIGTTCGTRGRWVDVKNRYLGLKFRIGAETHFGWARLSVVIEANHKIGATLTGYAYETIANKGIRAGQTGGEDSSSEARSDSSKSAVPLDLSAPSAPRVLELLQPVSLGRLAAGATDVSFRRMP